MDTDTQDPMVTEDTSTEYVDAVKQYMKENNINTDDAVSENHSVPQAVQDALLQENPVSPDSDEEDIADVFEDDTEKYNNIHLQTDTTFVDDELEQMTNLSMVKVKDFEYKITQSEKDAYLRCMLNDTPVILTVTTKGSNIDAVCRSLSVYEIELASQAGLQFVAETENQMLAELRWRAEIQKYRLAMQLVKLHNKMLDYLQFKPEPGKLQEHIALLRERATQVFSNMSVIRWKVSIHALNIFEYKLNRLNELALSPDFLNPGESD